MDEFWQRYGVFEDEDIDSARKVGRWTPTYEGNALVLDADDPLSVEWSMFHDLYA